MHRDAKPSGAGIELVKHLIQSFFKQIDLEQRLSRLRRGQQCRISRRSIAVSPQELSRGGILPPVRPGCQSIGIGSYPPPEPTK